MTVYGWMEEDNGKEMLLFLEEPNRQVSSIPTSGSLAVGMGTCLGDAICVKPAELKIPEDEAVNHFNNALKTNTFFLECYLLSTQGQSTLVVKKYCQ